MKIFIDTADLVAIKKWLKTGILDGVTTNPTHLSKAGGDPTAGVKEIAKLMGDRDVSVEVTETDPERVYTQAKAIVALAPNVVVKIPCALEYYSVIKRLVDEGVPLNITLVFSLMQGLAMCKLGVKYISPFIGRLDDINESGIGLVRDLRMMIDEYGYQTQLLAASIREVMQLRESILVGADVATVPVAVLEQATEHQLTRAGMKKFLVDWEQLKVKKFP